MNVCILSFALLLSVVTAQTAQEVVVDLSPLRAVGLDGLRFDAVSTCYLPNSTEVHILTTRTWIMGGSTHFAVGSIDPDWNAHSFPVYPLGFAITMSQEQFSGTLWHSPKLASFRGPCLLPSHFPSRSTNVGAESTLREMFGNILGCRVSSELVMSAVAEMGAGETLSRWTADGAGMEIQVHIADGLLGRLDMRQKHGGSARRFEYVYTGGSPRQLDRIDFCFGPDKTLLSTVPIAPGLDAASVEAIGGNIVDRHFGGWYGSLEFGPQELEDKAQILPVAIEVKLAVTGATLYTSRISGYRRIPKDMPLTSLDEERRAYGFAAQMTNETSPHSNPYYLRPAAEVSVTDRAIMLDAVTRSAAHAEQSDSPADGFFSLNLAMEVAILLSDKERAGPCFDAYLANMAENAGPRAVHECGVEALRYVLRRGDFELYNRMLPVFRRHLQVADDLHLACFDALDYSSSDRHWAAIEIAAAALATPNLDLRWRFRFMAIEAWSEWQLATPESKWFAHLINWGNVPPDLIEIPQRARLSRAIEIVNKAMAAFDTIRTTADSFDRQMFGELEGFLDPVRGHKTTQHTVSDGVVTVPNVSLPDTVEP